MKYKIGKYIVDAKSPEAALAAVKKVKAKDSVLYLVRYGHEGDQIQYTSVIGVKANSEQEAINKFKTYDGGKMKDYKVFYADTTGESEDSLRRKGMKIIDSVKDSDKYHLYRTLTNEINKKFENDFKRFDKPNEDGTEIFAEEYGIEMEMNRGSLRLVNEIINFVKSKGYKVEYKNGYLSIKDSMKDAEKLITPRGNFEIVGTWKEFNSRSDVDDWGFWFDHYTDDNKHYKIMHNHINNHGVAVLKDSLKK